MGFCPWKFFGVVPIEPAVVIAPGARAHDRPRTLAAGGGCHKMFGMPILPGELFGQQLSKHELFELQRLAFERELFADHFMRVIRWPGALALVIGTLASYAVHWAGAPPWARFIVGFGYGFALMSWLAPRAWERTLWRKWNSLEA